MSRFIVDELRFDLPDFLERSTQIFADSGTSRSTHGIVVSRAPLDEKTLPEFVDNQLTVQRKAMPHLTVLERKMGSMHGMPAADIRLRNRSKDMMLYQRIVAFEWATTCVIFTATAPMQHREASDRHLDAMLKTVKFRRPPVIREEE